MCVVTWVSFVIVRQLDIIELNVPTMAIPSSIKAVVYLSGEGFCQCIRIAQKATTNETFYNKTENVTSLLLAAH